MGLTQSTLFDQNKFLSEWTISHQLHNNHSLWTNNLNPNVQLEECPIFAHSEDDIALFKTLFQLRRNSPELVNAHYLKEIQKGGLCTAGAEGKLYLETIMLRLSEIEHLPYPDSLHLMFTALAGYRKLVRQVGVFKVQQSQIGFTQNGQAKVWLDSDFSAVRPSMMQHSEESMVYAIVQLVEDNADQETTPKEIPSLIKFIFEPMKNNGIVGFDEALIRVRDYANRYNDGQIPKYMECIRQVGVGKILNSLETTAKSYQANPRKEVGVNQNMWKSDIFQYRVDSSGLGNGINQINATQNSSTNIMPVNPPQTTSLTKALSTGQLNFSLPTTSTSKPIAQYIRQLSPRNNTNPLTLPSPNPRTSFQAQTPNIKLRNEAMWGNQRVGQKGMGQSSSYVGLSELSPRLSHQVAMGGNDVKQGNVLPAIRNTIVLQKSRQQGIVSQTVFVPQVISPKFAYPQQKIQANKLRFNPSDFPSSRISIQQTTTIPLNPQQTTSQPIISTNASINQFQLKQRQTIKQQQAGSNPEQSVLQNKGTNNENQVRKDQDFNEDELIAAHEPIEKLEELNDSVEEQGRVEKVSDDGGNDNGRELELSQMNGGQSSEQQVRKQLCQSQNQQAQLTTNIQQLSSIASLPLASNAHHNPVMQKPTPIQSPNLHIIHNPIQPPHHLPLIQFPQQSFTSDAHHHQSFIPAYSATNHQVVKAANGPVGNRYSQQVVVSAHQAQGVNAQFTSFSHQPVVVQGGMLPNSVVPRGSRIVQQVIGQPVMVLPRVSSQPMQQVIYPGTNPIIHNILAQVRISEKMHMENPLKAVKQLIASNQQGEEVAEIQQQGQSDYPEQEQFFCHQQLQLQPQESQQLNQDQQYYQQQQQYDHGYYQQQQQRQNNQQQYQQDQAPSQLSPQQQNLHIMYAQQAHLSSQEELSSNEQHSQQQCQLYGGYINNQPTQEHNQPTQEHLELHNQMMLTSGGQNIEDYADVLNSQQEQDLQQRLLEQQYQTQKQQQLLEEYQLRQYQHKNQPNQQQKNQQNQLYQHKDQYQYQQQYRQELHSDQDIYQREQQLQDEKHLYQDQQQHHQQTQYNPHQQTYYQHYSQQHLQKQQQPQKQPQEQQKKQPQQSVQQIHHNQHQSDNLQGQSFATRQSPQRQSKISLQSNIINVQISQSLQQSKSIPPTHPFSSKNHSQYQYEPLSIHTRERVIDLGNSPIIDFYKKDSLLTGGQHNHYNRQENNHLVIYQGEHFQQQNQGYNSYNPYNQHQSYDYHHGSDQQNRVSSSIDSQSYKQELYDTESPPASLITHQNYQETQLIQQQPLYRPLSKRQQQQNYTFDNYFDRTLNDNCSNNNQISQNYTKGNAYENYSNNYETTPVNEYSNLSSFGKLEKITPRETDNVAFSFGTSYHNSNYSSSGYGQVDTTPMISSSNSKIRNIKDVDLQDGKSPSFLLEEIRKITSNKSILSGSLSSNSYTPVQKYSFNSAQTSLNPKDIYNTFNSYSSSLTSNYSNDNNYSSGYDYSNASNESRTKSSYKLGDSQNYNNNKTYDEYNFQPQKSTYSSLSSHDSYNADNYNYGQNSRHYQAEGTINYSTMNGLSNGYGNDYTNTYNSYNNNNFTSSDMQDYNTEFAKSYQPNSQLMNDQQEYHVDFDPQILADIQKLSQ